jgi:ABC-2 type transport system permease protein
MKSVLAMIHREYLEHRGAFLYAPLVLLGLFTLAMAAALAFNKIRIPFDVDTETALEFYEVAFLGMGMLWFTYLMVALFFYFADAFNADRRNNAMLFWKSMPLSDFAVLGAKMLAGLTILPGLIFAALVVTGIVLYGLTGLAVTALPRLVVPGIGETTLSLVQVGSLALLHLGLALLWYAPFFAWVGALSTVVGRWSIPLAFLIPGLAILVENLFFRGIGGLFGNLLIPMDGPRGGYILEYLKERSTFGLENPERFEAIFSEDRAIDSSQLAAELIAGMDWAQMGIGLAVAAVLVFLASEYRRRAVVA